MGVEDIVPVIILIVVEYYADHFEILKAVVDRFNPSESKVVKTAQEIFKKNVFAENWLL